MHLDDSTYPKCTSPATTAADTFARRVAAAVQDSRPLTVFLISDFQILLEAMAQAIHLRLQRYTLLGYAVAANTAVPWGQQQPDVVLLDFDMDPQGAMLWLKNRCHDAAPRVLLFSRLGQTVLVDQAILQGRKGVIGPEASSEQFLRALDKVGQGEVWLDHANTSRLPHHQAHRLRRERHNPVSAKLALLTHKEQCILSKLLHHGGESAKLIASRLFISESTLRNHLTSI